jgi:fumarylpyruvate hydrolase
MSTAFPATGQVLHPIEGSTETFPVHRIYCIGRNYADHAEEMKALGLQTRGDIPLFFTKPADAIVLTGSEVPYPKRSSDVHHEIELVVALGKACSNIAPKDVPDHIFGYAVGIDLTRRDLQTIAKKAGTPWDLAKGFDNSAPLSPIRKVSKIGHPSHGRIHLSVNGEIRQDADISQMLWSVSKIIAELSTYYDLKAGDLFFTGTPAGVGAIKIGDTLAGGIEGVGEISINITS